MAVSFSSIPSNIRVPLFYAELDASLAGVNALDYPALLMGQRLSTGSVAADVLVQVATVAQAKDFFGTDSMLAEMVAAYRANDPTGELWCIAADDAGAGTAATGTIQVTAAATGDGVIYLYIAGRKVEVTVASGDVVNTIAAAINTAVGAALDLPVTSGVVGDTVTLTARHKGVLGNDIDVRINHLGAAGGEVKPASVTFDFNASGTEDPFRLTGGATNPTLTTPIAAMASEPFDYIGFPWFDATSLTAIASEMNDTAGRWSYLEQVYGHVFSVQRGTQGALTTAGNALNDQHLSMLGIEAETLTPCWEVLGALVGQAAKALRADPARPLQTLTLKNVTPAPAGNRFTSTERGTLLTDGIATQYTDRAGAMHVDRCITTYQTNALGQADGAYLDVTTMATLAHVIRDLKSAVTTKYPRHKLVNDGTRFGPGQAVVSPAVIRAEILARYQALEELALVENFDAFAAALTVERNGSDPNRVDVLFPPDLANQLRIFAVLVQFRLQFETA